MPGCSTRSTGSVPKGISLNESCRRRRRENLGRTTVVSELKWYDDKADNPPWIEALAEVRHRACEGWCSRPSRYV
jgi:hypothetical protein